MLTESFLNALRRVQMAGDFITDEDRGDIAHYEIYRDEFFGKRKAWCATVVTKGGERFEGFKIQYKSRKNLEETLLECSEAPIYRVFELDNLEMWRNL